MAEQDVQSNWQSGTASLGAVATGNADATAAGMAALREGGNAVDAAVAAGLAMGVVEPLDCGIGAGGFLVVHEAATGRLSAVDFIGSAPARAAYELVPGATTADGHWAIRVRHRANEMGHRSVAVPGAVRGLSAAVETFGRRSFADALEPAIRLAEEGFAVAHKAAVRAKRTEALIRAFPEMTRLMTRADGALHAVGERCAFPELGATLRRLAAAGPEDFYLGEIARRIVAEMRAGGGFLDAEDLASYRAVFRRPLVGRFREFEVATMPPPSTGGFTFAGLARLAARRPEAAERPRALAEAMRAIFAERAASLGDPAFVPVDLSHLGLAPAPETHETTSLAAVDAAGNACCITFSNNNHSGVVVPGTGIVLNNQMLLFNPWPGSPNSIVGGKRPVSSMMPTLIRDGSGIRLAIGASGSTRIPTAILQVLYGHLVDGAALPDAVAAPRLHAEVDDVFAEPGMAEAARPVADALGCRLTVLDGVDSWMGSVQSVAREPDGRLTAVGDPRCRGAGRVA